jgi:hypothetical protein
MWHGSCINSHKGGPFSHPLPWMNMSMNVRHHVFYMEFDFVITLDYTCDYFMNSCMMPNVA